MDRGIKERSSDSEARDLMICFRCGYSNGEVDIVGGIHKCPECDEFSYISIVTAMDILNEQYLKGILELKSEDMDDDYDELELDL